LKGAANEIAGWWVACRVCRVAGVRLYATGTLIHLFNPGDRHLGRYYLLYLYRKGSAAGQRSVTADGRAHLTIQSVPNHGNDSLADFLAKRRPLPHPISENSAAFFAVSSYKGNRVWYDRRNFSQRFVHCVLINYPVSEKRNRDDIVTRVSLSLRGDCRTTRAHRAYTTLAVAPDEPLPLSSFAQQNGLLCRAVRFQCWRCQRKRRHQQNDTRAKDDEENTFHCNQ
jgi:hypothetical protein